MSHGLGEDLSNQPGAYDLTSPSPEPRGPVGDPTRLGTTHVPPPGARVGEAEGRRAPGAIPWYRRLFAGGAPIPARVGRGPRSFREPESSIGVAKWYQRNLIGRVDLKHLAGFCRKFASYLDAGVSLNRSLDSLRRQYQYTTLGPVIGRLMLATRRGESLSDAISHDPGAFDHLFRNMMRVGEARGGIPETLRMLAGHYEARLRLRDQARSALIYPAIVLLLAFFIGGFVSLVILPRIVAVLQDVVKYKKIVLPLPARMLFAFSDFVRRTGWWLIPSVFLGTVVVLWLLYRTSFGKAVLDRIAMVLPVLGKLLRRIDITRFAKALGSLLDGGVDIGTALTLTSGVLLLTPMRQALARARESVLQGGALSEALEASHRFPHDVIAFIESGEETGRLPEMLLVLADDYETQVAFMVMNLGNIIQPLLLLFVGGLVCFVAISFFMAYSSIISSLVR